MTPSNAASPGKKGDTSATLRVAVLEMWSAADQITKRFLIGTLLLVLASSVAAALAPLVLKALIDTLDFDGISAIGVGAVYLILLYAFCQWFSRSLGELRAMLLGRTDQRLQRQLSDRFFRHVMCLPLRFHLERKTGALNQTLTNGLLGYRIVLFHLVNGILPIVVEFAAMCVILVTLGHPVFIVIIGLSVLLYAVAFWVGAKRVSGPASEASTAHIDTGAVITDSILNFETVKYFNGVSRVHDRFRGALKRTEARWARLFARRLESGVVIATIFTLSLGLSVYVAAKAVLDGNMSIGEFVLVNAYVLQLARPLELLGFAFRDIVQGVAFIDKTTAVSSEKREHSDTNEGGPLPFGTGKLVFDKVSFAYEADRMVLRNVSFSVAPGGTLAIVGASGSGKSSIIRLLVRLLEPTSGTISIGGRSLSSIPVAALRDAIAVVPQETALFNDSIAYNIGFGKDGCTFDEIVAAARIAGAHDFVLNLPDAYDTKIGERGVKLSGGERQRIAIARAAIKKPEMFAFDEPTASLDSTTEHAILQNFVEMTEDTTVVIIAHRLSTVVHADEIVVLDAGCVIERGTHAALVRERGVYAGMWFRQYQEASRRNRCMASVLQT